MGWMFDGTPVLKRRVNLSGVSHNAGNLASFTAMLQLQRDARERGSRRNNAAIKIQRFCRAYLNVLNYKVLLRVVVDNTLNQLLHGISTYEIGNTTLLVNKTVRQFVYIAVGRQARSHYFKLVHVSESCNIFLMTTENDTVSDMTPQPGTLPTLHTSHLRSHLSLRTDKPVSAVTSKCTNSEINLIDRQQLLEKELYRRSNWLSTDDLKRLDTIVNCALSHLPISSPLEDHWLKLLFICLSHCIPVPLIVSDLRRIAAVIPTLCLASALAPLSPTIIARMLLLFDIASLLKINISVIHTTVPQLITALHNSDCQWQRALFASIMMTILELNIDFSMDLFKNQFRILFPEIHKGAELSKYFQLLDNPTRCYIQSIKQDRLLHMVTMHQHDYHNALLFPSPILLNYLYTTILHFFQNQPLLLPLPIISCRRLNNFIIKLFVLKTDNSVPMIPEVILVLDILLSSCISTNFTTGVMVSPPKEFNNALDMLLLNENLMRLTDMLRDPISPEILLSLCRLFFPLSRHSWLNGKLIRPSSNDFIEYNNYKDTTESIHSMDSLNDDEECNDSLDFISKRPKKSLQCYLQEFSESFSEEFIYTPMIVNHFSMNGLMIKNLKEWFYTYIQKIYSDSNHLIGQNQSMLEYIIDDILQPSSTLSFVLNQLVVLGTLLEKTLRPVHSTERYPNLSSSCYIQSNELFKLTGVLWTESEFIYCLNSISVVLIEICYGCHRPLLNYVYPNHSHVHNDSTIASSIGVASMLLGRVLRDLHRLRSDLLHPSDWLVHTSLLKPTDQLLDQFDYFRTQHHLPFYGTRPRHYKPSDVTIIPTQFVLKTLSILLTHLPHSFKFGDRTIILNLLLLEDKLRLFGDITNPFHERRGVPFKIRRSNIVNDTLTSMKETHLSSWKTPFYVTFYNDSWIPEKGVDGGGLFREYLIILSRYLFSPSFGLFDALPDRTLVPSSRALCIHGVHADILYRLAGSVVGKAMYEGIILEALFNRTFFNLIHNRQTQHLEDLLFLDPHLFNQLRHIETSKNVEELELTFSVTFDKGDGSVEEIDLIPNGRTILVETATLQHYISALTDYHLNKRFSHEAHVFCQGLSEVVPLEWCCFFDPLELSYVVSGQEIGLNVLDLSLHTEYSGGFSSDSLTIQYLWCILNELNSKEQGEFLMFVTACSRPPFLGFRLLQPRFKIHRVEDQRRLPTSCTCINQLNLPDYGSKSLLRNKLLSALALTEGFHLS